MLIIFGGSHVSFCLTWSPRNRIISLELHGKFFFNGRPPYTTCVLMLWVIRILRLTWHSFHKLQHCQNRSDCIINLPRKWHSAVHHNPQISDRINTIKEENSAGWRSLKNVIDLHLPMLQWVCSTPVDQPWSLWILEK
jgi:hypothetical protein